MTPMADLFMNIHNETAYANSSTHRLAVDSSDVEQSDWYFQVNTALYFQLQKPGRQLTLHCHLRRPSSHLFSVLITKPAPGPIVHLHKNFSRNKQLS